MISFIIPTYQEEATIAETLKRIRSYSGQKQIIVTDDKSTDKTVEIARIYADMVLSPEVKHKTIGANRNFGAKKATGDFLVFMDADSRVDNIDDLFAHAIKRFEIDKNLVALTSALYVIPEFETFGDKIMYRAFNLVHHVKNNILHIGEASGKFQMMRREAFIAVGGYREDLVSREDGNMFYRLSKIGNTVYDGSLKVFHTGRRAHIIGWPKLLSIWMLDVLWVTLFNKSFSKDWLQPKSKV